MINKKAFTLIEVLIAVGIVTIVSAIVLGLINPERQRNRARDAVLQKTVSGLAEAVENFRNLRGEQVDCSTNIAPYLSDDITIDSSSSHCNLANVNQDYIEFSNGSVFSNRLATTDPSGQPIVFYISDGNGDQDSTTYCIEAQTNDDTSFWYVWQPGSSVNRTDQSTERCQDLLGP